MTASDTDHYPSVATDLDTTKPPVLSRRRLLELAAKGIALAGVVGCSSNAETNTYESRPTVDQQSSIDELNDEFYEYQRQLAKTIIDFVSAPDNDGMYFYDPTNIEAGRSAISGFGNMLRDSSEEQLAIGYVALINNDKLKREYPETLYSIEAEILNGSKIDPKCMYVQLPIGGETAVLVSEWEKSGKDLTTEILKEWVDMRDGDISSRITATLSEDGVERVAKMIAYSDAVVTDDPVVLQKHIDFFMRTAEQCNDEMGLEI